MLFYDITQVVFICKKKKKIVKIFVMFCTRITINQSNDKDLFNFWPPKKEKGYSEFNINQY